MDLIPTSDSVIIKEVPMKEHQKGGIILSKALAPNLAEGEVMAVGPGAVAFGHRVALDIIPGDIITFITDLPMQPIIEEGERFMMIRAAAVLAYRKSTREKIIKVT